jgi:hypothetical protein
MCWINKGEGFNQGKGELLAFFNLVKVAKKVLRGGNCGLSLSYKILLITTKYVHHRRVDQISRCVYPWQDSSA